jgi:protein SCO1
VSQKQVFFLLLFAAALGVGALGLHQFMTAQQDGVRVQEKGTSGEARIGGPFELVDTKGQVRTDAEFRGRFMLVFFGYTNCPDVCPTTLLDLTQALDELGPAAEKIQPIFITVDPLRDTPEAIAGYLEAFHSSFIGLTGTRQQLAAVERAYSVYAKAAGAPAKEGSYLVDHTALAYLLGPDGKFRAFISPGRGADAAAAKIKPFL